MKMKAIIDLGVIDSKGMFTAKYSSWRTETFSSREEMNAFGKGVVCGLEYKWTFAACQIRFDDGTTELFY